MNKLAPFLDAIAQKDFKIASHRAAHVLFIASFVTVLGFSFVIALVACTVFFKTCVFFRFLSSFMERTSRCSGCKIPCPGHSFGKPGKNCTGPVQDVSGDSTDLSASAPKDQVVSSEEMNIQDTLVYLLGAVKNLSAGLDEVKADNQHLRALVEEKQEVEGRVARLHPLTKMAPVFLLISHSLLVP